MTKARKLAEDIVNSARVGNVDILYLYQYAENSIQYFWDDASKLVKNINQTSLDDKDRFNRIVQFEIDFGLSKTHLI